MKEILITMKSQQFTAEDEESTKLITAGTLEEEENGSFTLSYEETEATGFSGSTTSVIVTPERMVTILRSGSATANLVIEPKKQNFSLYDTPFGTMSIGVLGKDVILEKDENKGLLEMNYQLQLGSNCLSDNRLEIRWKTRQ